ncbi:MAG: transglutaminase family protein [Acidimicrobiales bacterium]
MSDSSMLLHIRHVTGFSYDGAADSSYNEVRMTPLTLDRQRVVASSLEVTPYALQSTYRDYFGTIVTTFDLHDRHRQLEVVAEATVETFDREVSESALDVATLSAAPWNDRLVEYVAPTARTAMSGEVLDEFRDTVAGVNDPREIADAALSVVAARMQYVRGATLVSSTAQEAWDESKGVCQDLTHVTIALLRSAGVPARYVSGYLHSDPEAAVGETILGESHAWVEYFAGAWRGIDPTNGGDVGLRHVTVAKGREYGDVPPLKGIYHGDPSSALGVVVEVTRLS